MDMNVQTFEDGEWRGSWSINDLPDWTWDDKNNIVIINRDWFNDNYKEIKEWFMEQAGITHLTFQGDVKIHTKNLTPELKTLFTLRWK
jgi:hypothetical protein